MTIVLALVWWSLRRAKLGLITLLLGILAFEVIQPVALNSLGDLSRLAQFLPILPSSIWALLNVTPAFLVANGAAGYLSLGFTHPVFIVLVAALVVWFVARSFAAEIERGTIQIALSRPISRRRYFSSRVMSAVIAITVTAVTGPLGMALGIWLQPPAGSPSTRNLLLTGVDTWLLMWAIAGITLLWSAIVDSMSRAVGLTIGVLVASYVIDYFGNLWSTLKPLQPISLFHYYDPAGALAIGTLDTVDVVVLLTLGVVGTIAADRVFERRDLPV